MKKKENRGKLKKKSNFRKKKSGKQWFLDVPFVICIIIIIDPNQNPINGWQGRNWNIDRRRHGHSKEGFMDWGWKDIPSGLVLSDL